MDDFSLIFSGNGSWTRFNFSELLLLGADIDSNELNILITLDIKHIVPEHIKCWFWLWLDQTTINVFHTIHRKSCTNKGKNGLMIIHINQIEEITESKYYRSCCWVKHIIDYLPRGNANKEVGSERKINPFHIFFFFFQPFLKECWYIHIFGSVNAFPRRAHSCIMSRSKSKEKNCWITSRTTMWYLILFS